MSDNWPIVSEVSEDLAHGQVAIVTFRWILVVAGLLFSLWNPGPIGILRIQILVILLLAVSNFYLLAQLLMGRTVNDQLVYAASAADLIVITTIVSVQGDFNSNVYVFYYPAIMVFSVVFPATMTLMFTGSIISLYFLISYGTAVANQGDLQILITRLLMLAAVAFCGNLYWRIEAKRRRVTAEAREKMMAQISTRSAVKRKST
ncbi:MAG: hypothetical protein IIA59_07610 [Candidatus Marinimicrobia bacterium]|nr:hypothetical protein [Candidatus Neomarinimicrobiota bacterium]